MTNSADVHICLSFARAGDFSDLDTGVAWLQMQLQRTFVELTGRRLELILPEGESIERPHWLSPYRSGEKPALIFIPFLTQSYFEKFFRIEAELFLSYEAEIGRNDLMLPIQLADIETSNDSIAKQLVERRYADWRGIPFWSDNAPNIRQRIADLVRRIAEIAERNGASIPPPIPDQEVGIRFRVNEDGLIDRAADDAPDVRDDDPEMLAKRDGLLEACNRFLQPFSEGTAGANAFGLLINRISTYREAITGPLSELPYSEIWRQGSRIQNAADAAMRDVDRLEPSLEDEQQAALQDIVDEHGPFIYSTHVGRTQQAMADRYKATQEERAAKRQAAEAFAEAVNADHELFSEPVRDVIVEVTEEMEEGRHPERQFVLAETTHQNLLSVVGQAAVFTGCAAASAVIGEATIGASVGKGSSTSVPKLSKLRPSSLPVTRPFWA